MVREDLVRRKLATLHGYIEELADHRDVTLQEYVTGSVRRRAVERLLQLIIEVAADINTHLVTEIEGMPPADHTDSFAAAARIGAIDVDLAARLKPQCVDARVRGYRRPSGAPVDPFGAGWLWGVSAPGHPVGEQPVEWSRVAGLRWCSCLQKLDFSDRPSLG